MAGLLDLDWEEDALWEKEGLFLFDEAYKEIYARKSGASLHMGNMIDVSPVQTSRWVDVLLKNVLKSNKYLTHSVEEDLDAEEGFYKTFGEKRYSNYSSLKVKSSPEFVNKGKLTGEVEKSKRNQKSLKVRSDRPMYILGKDVSLDKVVSLSMKALVGNFFYIKMGKNKLKQWI
jgi:hypothetical protein